MLCPAVTYNEDILPMYYVLLYRVNIGVGGLDIKGGISYTVYTCVPTRINRQA